MAPTRKLVPVWATRGVLGIVAATFLSDVGHELVTAVLPLYLASVGLGPAALGVMEGAADLVYGLSKVAGGFVGRRLRAKRPLVAAGYATTALASGATALISSVPAFAALRAVAWFGRGIRSPLRDFLLADEVEPTHFGRAYGVERSADMLGAVLGPFLALGLLALGAPLPVIIGVSVIPGLGSALSILLFTRDRGATEAAPVVGPSAPLPRKFWVFLVGVLLFGLGDFSRSFLILLAARALGDAPGALGAGVAAYAIHNVISAVAAVPAGRFADRVPKSRVLVVGYGLGVLTHLLLAGGSGSIGVLALAVVGSGIYVAIEETVEKAAVAELLTRDQRSVGFGILAGANALGDLVSSLYVGTLLGAGEPGAAFGLAAAFAAAGAAWVMIVGARPGASAAARA